MLSFWQFQFSFTLRYSGSVTVVSPYFSTNLNLKIGAQKTWRNSELQPQDHCNRFFNSRSIPNPRVCIADFIVVDAEQERQ